jgi:hypothetical protein
MLGALALVLASAAAPPVVALMPLRPLGAPPDLVQALEVTLRNELTQLQEVRLAQPKDVANALKREPGCETRIPCAAAAAHHAGARQLIVGTTSQFGDAFMIDLKLLDAKSGQELRRATHPVSGSQEAVIEMVREVAVKLMAPARYAGSLRIDAGGVEGALLFVDGKPVGALPLSAPMEGLAPGQHVVRIKDKDRETSTFVEVRFARTTEVRLELGAAPVVAVPAAALPSLVAASPRKPAWVRPAAIGAIGASVACAVLGVALHARADSAASLSGRPGPSQLGTVGDVDRDTNLSRGFYVAAAVLAATGGGLLFWDLSTDSVGLQTHF